MNMKLKVEKLVKLKLLDKVEPEVSSNLISNAMNYLSYYSSLAVPIQHVPSIIERSMDVEACMGFLVDYACPIIWEYNFKVPSWYQNSSAVRDQLNVVDSLVRNVRGEYGVTVTNDSVNGSYYNYILSTDNPNMPTLIEETLTQCGINFTLNLHQKTGRY